MRCYLCGRRYKIDKRLVADEHSHQPRTIWAAVDLTTGRLHVLTCRERGGLSPVMEPGTPLHAGDTGA